ncbi:hypothetical protein Tco_0623100 [Tanacetum coccineum]
MNLRYVPHRLKIVRNLRWRLRRCPIFNGFDIGGIYVNTLAVNHNIINKDNTELIQRLFAITRFVLVLEYGQAPIDKVPVLQVQHQVPNQFETPLVESEEDPASPQEILQESLKLLARPQVASSLTFTALGMFKVSVSPGDANNLNDTACLRGQDHVSALQQTPNTRQSTHNAHQPHRHQANQGTGAARCSSSSLSSSYFSTSSSSLSSSVDSLS